MTIRAAAVLLLAGVLSCASWSWPQWSEELVSSLDCGMAPQEVRDLAGQDLKPVTSVAFRGVYGTHTVDKGDVTVWLHFDEGRLEGVSRWRPEAWKLKSVHISPKTNLCTGELSYFLRLSLQAALDDPTVYLDGEKVEDPWERPLEVTEGDHELRIEAGGYQPILKRVSFPEGDSGHRWLKITHDDLQPVAAAS